MADRIVLTKDRPRSDLDDVAALEVEVAQINPNAPRIYGDHRTRSNASASSPSTFFERISAAVLYRDVARGEQGSLRAQGYAHKRWRTLIMHTRTRRASSIVCATPLVWREFEAWLRRIRIDWSSRCYGSRAF